MPKKDKLISNKVVTGRQPVPGAFSKDHPRSRETFSHPKDGFNLNSFIETVMKVFSGVFEGKVAFTNETTFESTVNLTDLPVYADNAAALSDNAEEGSLYKTAATGDASVNIVNPSP